MSGRGRGLRSGMHFSLVDRVLEASTERAVTLKAVTRGEEYLQDHFPSFPVLPGVMMLEAMVQAGQLIAARRGTDQPLVLHEVRALKYNRFVPPGSTIRATVEAGESQGRPDCLDLRGRVELLGEDGEAVAAASGRFSLRPVRAG